MRSLRTYVAIAIILVVMVVDQLIKFEIKTGFLLHESRQVTDWFYLLFTENRGMAFGMEFISTLFLTLFRMVAIAYFCMALARLVRQKAPMGVVVFVAMVIAGAAGNIIDNMFYGMIFSESTSWGAPAALVPWGEGYGSFLNGRVVDMFYFPLFTWPEWMPLVGGDVFFGAIFNFADASISCGAIGLALFYFKYISRSGAFALPRLANK